MKPGRAKPLICLISDGSIDDANFETRGAALLELISAAVKAHIPLVQIREKRLCARNLFDLARRAAARTKSSVTKLLINDRVDIATASGADGVHLTSRSVGSEIVRSLAGDEFLIAVSAHSIDELKAAARGGADLAVLAPIFETPEKPNLLGLPVLADAVRSLPDLPILALGGIDPSNYHKALDTGAAGFAAIRFLNDRAVLDRLRTEFDL